MYDPGLVPPSGPPIHLYYSDSDWLATGSDVEHFLLKRLPPTVLAGAHKLEGFNHNDFLWGMRAPTEVYAPIVDEIWRSERHADGRNSTGDRETERRVIGQNGEGTDRRRDSAFVVEKEGERNSYGEERGRRRRRRRKKQVGLI